MGGFEYLRALDLETAKFVDVEEAPPIDVIACGTPAGQSVILAFQQFMQPFETFRVARIKLRQATFDRLNKLRLCLEGGRQRVLGFLRFVVSLRVAIQALETRCQFVQLRAFGCSEQRPIGARIDREVVLVMLDAKAGVLSVKAQRHFIVLQNGAVVGAQER